MLLAQVITPDVDWQILSPMLFLGVAGLLILTMTSIRKDLPAWFITSWTVTAAALSAIAGVFLWDRLGDEGPGATIASSVGFDGFSIFLSIVIALSVAMAALLVHTYVEREELDGVEIHVLLLLSGAGGVIMSFSNDLIVFFLGLETLSLAVYVLAALHRRRYTSQEAGMKYFALGAFSSTFFLYGMALIYGATGSLNLVVINDFLLSGELTDDGLLLGGIALLIVGLVFKVGAAPFHSWTPDVYDGSPTPVVAYMASGVKVAGFAGLLRIMSVTFEPIVDDWRFVIEVIAALTLIIGSVSAIVQTNVKRMLAYSSISHAGFILLGVLAATERGTAASLFYVASYTFLVAGTFGALSIIGAKGDNEYGFDVFNGLAKRRPTLAFALLIYLLAQAGVPLTSGFFAKFEVIAAAVDARSYWTAIVAMMAAVIGAYLYLRVLIAMFMSEPAEDAPPVVVPPTVAVVLGVSVIVTLLFGIFPGLLDGLAQDAMAVLANGG